MIQRLKMKDLKDKKCNMHTHTTRCNHAKGTEREYVEKAIEAGFEVLGFSDHAPYLFEDGHISRIRMRMDELEGYVDTVSALRQEYRNDIEIYCGLEMEYFPKLFERTLEEIDHYPMDYLLLGQHFYDDEAGWITPKTPWSDEEHLKLYADRVITAIRTEQFLYVAHPDIMNFTGDAGLYRKYMGSIAQELKDHGMPIEVNVNGCREGLHYPTSEFIRLGAEIGTDFIIGVDAHTPEDLTDHYTYEKCRQMVSDVNGRLIHQL